MEYITGKGYLLPAMLCLFIGFSCETYETGPPLNPGQLAPTIYNFERNGESSVEYPGQTVRLLLIQDIKKVIDRLAKPGAQAIDPGELQKFFDLAETEGQTLNENILTNTGNFPTTSISYFDIHSAKGLEEKLADGFGLKEQITSWIQILSMNSHQPGKLSTPSVLIDEDTGLDLAQAIQKTLLGAVVFYQATQIYLSDIESRENNVLKEDGNGGTFNYTDREHRFDEAFGYFGAARNIFDFSLEDLAGQNGGRPYKDNFVEEGEIDFSSEYNFAFASNAAKRDLGSASGTDFSREISRQFLKARYAISQKDDLGLLDSKEQILLLWQKILAATSIHYINEVRENLIEIQTDPTTQPFEFYEHWAEMYYYTEAFRYYSGSLIDHESILSGMKINGEVSPKTILADPDMIDPYLQELTAIKTSFQNAFQFQSEDVDAW